MIKSFYRKLRTRFKNTDLVKYYSKIESARSLPKYSISQDDKGRSIVFLSPAVNIAVGGIKVIYNHVSAINSLDYQLTASVLHPFDKTFRCTWFEHSAILKTSLEFNLVNDFAIIPEVWAIPHAKLLHDLGIRYGIYVQNGYVITANGGTELDAAYKNSDLILAISDDTAECIKIAYPECSGKVYRTHYSVNSDKFSASLDKENVICYMPRKLKKHSELVIAFLAKNLPSHWKIESIDGIDEHAVARIFGRSKIFLSFSEFEGCPLPPVEAGLSGCQVIGYTGEGAKEYWDKEIFSEIHSGDIRSFTRCILEKVAEIDRTTFSNHPSAIKKLADTFSSKAELSDMQSLSLKVVNILNSTAGLNRAAASTTPLTDVG